MDVEQWGESHDKQVAARSMWSSNSVCAEPTSLALSYLSNAGEV